MPKREVTESLKQRVRRFRLFGGTVQQAVNEFGVSQFQIEKIVTQREVDEHRQRQQELEEGRMKSSIPRKIA